MANDNFPLKKGSNGNNVVLLQQKLNVWGAKLVADGGFGDLTEKALLHYTGKTVVDSVDGLLMLTVPVDGKKTKFVLEHFSDAKANETVTKVPAIFTLAQAGLESNWGLSAFGNNFFGIKKGAGYVGLTQKLKTWECGSTGVPANDGIKDEVIQIFAPNTNPAGICKNKYAYRVFGVFRAYLTAQNGFYDHDQFLITNKRYSKAFGYTDPKKFASEIAKAGYASAPDYESVLHSTIDTVTKILQENKLVSI